MEKTISERIDGLKTNLSAEETAELLEMDVQDILMFLTHQNVLRRDGDTYVAGLIGLKGNWVVKDGKSFSLTPSCVKRISQAFLLC